MMMKKGQLARLEKSLKQAIMIAKRRSIRMHKATRGATRLFRCVQGGWKSAMGHMTLHANEEVVQVFGKRIFHFRPRNPVQEW